MSLIAAALLGTLLPFGFTPSADSTGMLVGRVADATDSAGVAGANVHIVGTSLTVRTDARGMFRLRGVPAGPHQIEVRAFRYSPDTVVATFVVADSVRVQIYMHRLAHLLSEMVVQGRAMRVPRGFEAIYARGARGWGTFITTEQIDSIGPKDVKTMFQAIRGVVVTEAGVFFNRCGGNPAIWTELAELWVDGDRVTRFNSGDRTGFKGFGDNPTDARMMNYWLESIPPSDVQAIEVYTSGVTIPAEFASGGSPCAVIAVWRKH